MLKKIRPYEVSVWTLQDSYITTLKVQNLNTKGQIEEPQIMLKTDGTQELTFKVPMYCREKGEYFENPLWYDIKHGLLLVGLRKIKVIFNKGIKEKEEILEFLIMEVSEKHSKNELYCEVKSSGLAFQELGKIGTQLVLNPDDYYYDYNNYYDNVILQAEKDNLSEEEISNLLKKAPINNISYWCEKIFKDTDWKYSIQMNWYAYDGRVLQQVSQNEDSSSPIVDLAIVGKAQLGKDAGIRKVINYLNLSDKQKAYVNDLRENAQLRRYDKIYEDDYVSSWIDGETNLIPKEIVRFKEKTRLVTSEKGNIYNHSQKIAETFGVYCKYKYHYDDNYHIIGKEVIFYNSFLEEQEGHLDLTYPYTSSEITREMDSNDICTKLYIENVEDEDSANGVLSIATSPANKSKENYILNFDYLYQINAITKEQYESIFPYERQMFFLNSKIDPKANQINSLVSQINEYKSNLSLLEKSIILDNEQINQAKDLLNSITEGKGKITLTEGNAYRGVLLPDNREGSLLNSFRIKLSIEGIIHIKGEDEIKIYKNFINNSLEEQLDSNSYTIEKDSNNNIIGIKNILPTDDNRIYFLTFSYEPKLHYDNIIATYMEKLTKDMLEKESLESLLKKAEEILNKISEEYDKLLEEKQKTIKDFNLMMGPALREGFWKPENYNNYGSKYLEKITINKDDASEIFPANNSNLLSFIWDDKNFEEEQLNYWEEGINLTKKYYPYIILNEDYLTNDVFIKYPTNFKFSYKKSEQDRDFFVIGSQLQYSFLRKDNKIYPILLITGAEDVPEEELIKFKEEPKFEVYFLEENNTLSVSSIDISIEDIFIPEESYEIVYPRIKIKNLSLKTSDNNLKIEMLGESFNYLKTLEKYVDYSLLLRQESYLIEGEQYKKEQDECYLITINPKLILLEGSLKKTFRIFFEVSNADLNIYLDSLEVSKNNAFPQASYKVKISVFDENFLLNTYHYLGRIAHINDWELKFENVQGYVSELKLKLDKPWEDEITIQNYKNKFEDLFSKIVASTAQMQANSEIYNKAAAAFNSKGIIHSSNIQEVLNNSNLDYSFLNGNLTINEEEGIWGKSDEGVVAYTGGGIFTATSKDAYGNWLWNTGITPSGINASLLTAGQIDTNLIRIYSGNNLRFQLKGDGLFAYQQLETGEHNPNQYVVHNRDGLFLTALKGEVIEGITLKEDIDRVAISWDGITIRDLKNEKVFFADKEGNLNIKGIIQADQGKIGGWTIGENSLYTTPSASEEKNIFSGIANNSFTQGKFTNILNEENNIYKVFWAGSEEDENQFYVDSTGVLYSSSVVVNNSLVAQNITLGNISLREAIETSLGIKVTPLNGTIFKLSSNQSRPENDILQFSLTGSYDVDFTQESYISLKILKKEIIENIEELVEEENETSDSTQTIEEINDENVVEEEIEDNFKKESYEIEYWEDATNYFSIISSSANYLTFSVKYDIMLQEGVEELTFKICYTQDDPISGKDSISYDDLFNLKVVKDGKDGQDGKDGKDGESPIFATIESKNGIVFKNKEIQTELVCHVFKGNIEITESLNDDAFTWYKRSSNGTDYDTNWGKNNFKGPKITIDSSDIDEKSIFVCEVDFGEKEEG